LSDLAAKLNRDLAACPVTSETAPVAAEAASARAVTYHTVIIFYKMNVLTLNIITAVNKTKVA
jgi:hypothetical protein